MKDPHDLLDLTKENPHIQVHLNLWLSGKVDWDQCLELTLSALNKVIQGYLDKYPEIKHPGPPIKGIYPLLDGTETALDKQAIYNKPYT